MSKQTTEYEARKAVATELAVEKAKRHGESTWGFDYRGQNVEVTARRVGGSVRVSTQHVKNKGK